MDRVKYFQECILEVLEPYAKTKIAYPKGLENTLIVDKENYHYQIVTKGWDGHKPIFNVPIHIDIINNKIWVQRNMADVDLDNFFWSKGILKSEIVLGFLHPEMREYSDFAVA